MAGWGRPWPAGAVAVLGLAGVLAVSGFGAQQGSGSGGWGKAVTLRGAATPPSAISCSSPGNCGAAGIVGGYVYVASQVRGRWGNPKVIPGTARTAKPSSSPGGIACFPGGCAVAGTYRDFSGHNQAFITRQSRGTWARLMWVPGLARLDKGNSAGLGELACRSAGNCYATGSYTDAKGQGHPFLVFQVRGAWGSAMTLPAATGLPGQQPGTIASPGPVSCAAPGNCAAAGTYPVAPGPLGAGNQAYLQDEVNGTWRAPGPVPGLAALNTGLQDSISVISCPSAGNCSAAGGYIDAATGDNNDSFVISQTNGTWGTATELKTNIPYFSYPDGDYVTSISCAPAGNCVAAGQDQVQRNALTSQVFFVTETHGTWGDAIPVPGTNQLNQGQQAGISQITCPAAGNCGAAGWYSAAYAYGNIYTQPFLITEAHGTWHNAIPVPGIKALPPADGEHGAATAISCPAADRCSAGGYYQTLNGDTYHFYGFVDSQP